MKFERLSSAGWLVATMANYTENCFEEVLNKHGLTTSSWQTLYCLFEREGVTQQSLSEHVNVKRSTTTRNLDKLAKLNLIERRINPDCRRSFLIYLTDEGGMLKDELMTMPQQFNEKLLSQLSVSEAEQLINLMAKLVRSLDR
ncbi:MAG: MarR family winged helix-turn-helix transcriptional regulator [Psychrobium sp.]